MPLRRRMQGASRAEELEQRPLAQPRRHRFWLERGRPLAEAGDGAPDHPSVHTQGRRRSIGCGVVHHGRSLLVEGDRARRRLRPCASGHSIRPTRSSGAPVPADPPVVTQASAKHVGQPAGASSSTAAAVQRSRPPQPQGTPSTIGACTQMSADSGTPEAAPGRTRSPWGCAAHPIRRSQSQGPGSARAGASSRSARTTARPGRLHAGRQSAPPGRPSQCPSP